jgi:hypothetical protein
MLPRNMGFLSFICLSSNRISEVIETMSPIGDIKPITETQTRPLTGLKPAQQKEVLQKAVKTVPDGKITARLISVLWSRSSMVSLTGDGSGSSSKSSGNDAWLPNKIDCKLVYQVYRTCLQTLIFGL